MDRHAHRRLFPSRQALLFVAAMGVPCVLLVGLSIRMMVQDRELAEKRAADDRRRIASETRQGLLSRLERLRMAAANADGDPQLTPEQRQTIALVARVEHERLVLPWEAAPALGAFSVALDRGRFADLIRLGEREELADRVYEKAVEAYRRALASARAPSHAAFAKLLLARALTHSGRRQEAEALYRSLLQVPPEIVDEQGIPLGLYAARRLLEAAAPLERDGRPVVVLLTRVDQSRLGAIVLLGRPGANARGADDRAHRGSERDGPAGRRGRRARWPPYLPCGRSSKSCGMLRGR